MWLSTGCEKLDAVLGGGFRVCGGITELSGEAGCGKTQFCLTLSMQVSLPEVKGGLGGAACYMSCGEGRFPVARLGQLAQCYQQCYPDEDIDFLANVFIEEFHNSEEVMDNLRKLVPEKCRQNNVRLLIIDSVAGMFRTEFDATDKEQAKLRLAIMYRFAAELRHLADTYSLCVVVVNQVTASVDQEQLSTLFTGTFGGAKVDPVPSLGLGWSNCVNTRIMLRRDASALLGLGSGANGAGVEAEDLLLLASPPLDENAYNGFNGFNGLAGGAEGVGGSASSSAPTTVPASFFPVPAAVSASRRYMIVLFSPLVPCNVPCPYVVTTGGVRGVGSSEGWG